MKKGFRTIMIIGAMLLFACGRNTSPTADRVPVPEKLLLNGRFYTANPAQPWAAAMLIKNSKIVYVGDRPGALRRASAKAKRYDLRGRVIMPGFVDSHTHPGLMAAMEADGPGPEIPEESKKSHEALMSWLKKFADDNPFHFVIAAGSWPTRLYGPTGPHKRELDKVVRWRPVLLFDDSGHSLWANSMMLRLLGVDKDTPDPAPGLSHFVRDEKGELTGWIKEFAAMPALTKFMIPGEDDLRKGLLRILKDFRSRGVTTIWDGGNLLSQDAIYFVLAQLDREGRLPVRYHGSYHVIYPNQIKNAVSELKRLRRQYGGNRLKFNTIKIHFDGVSEIRTAALLKPYADHPKWKGKTLLTRERLRAFIQELNEQKIDLHLHAVGDGATRAALDAVRDAGKLQIRITLSHLEQVDEKDIPRFKKLGVIANFTPHWFGGIFGDASFVLGSKRNRESMRARSFFDAGAMVTFSSDMFQAGEMDRAGPLLGMRIAATRAEPGAKRKAFISANETVSVERSTRAYTSNGAYQLGLENQVGMLRAGMLADLVVLSKDPFSTPAADLHLIKPEVVIFDGRVVNGELRE